MPEFTAWTQGALGPFFKAGAPDKGDGLPGYMFDSNYKGDLLKLEINVRDTSGAYVHGSTIEIWHCDENGVYDETGYKYRVIWHTAGTHAGIDVTTAFPGIATYNGKQIYRHVHMIVTPPLPKPGVEAHIVDLRCELELMLPPWTDTLAEIGLVDDARNTIRLGGPNTGGFGTQKWYLAKTTIILDNVFDD